MPLIVNDLIGVAAGALVIVAAILIFPRAERIVGKMNRAAAFNKHRIVYTAANIRRVAVASVALGALIIIISIVSASSRF